MGNDQSSSAASTPAPGVSSSFSFLARRRASQKSQIVVVNASNQPLGDPADDADLKKLKEIPRFFPILKGCLAGHRDSPEIFTKVDHRYIFRFLNRLQQHFAICSQAVATEQTAIYAKVAEADHMIHNIGRKLSQNTRKFEVLCNELKKAEAISAQLDDIQVLLQEILPQVELLNDLLPEAERLPPLSLAPPTSCYASIGQPQLSMTTEARTGNSKAKDSSGGK
ncbi:loss of heterozygosity 12 chromosomal region 1 protein [Aphelenchoides avenae]|nr:loss of heterozygosity 12 chromosomal region 1 protein [Aphelenchus avenae]